MLRSGTKFQNQQQEVIKFQITCRTWHNIQERSVYQTLDFWLESILSRKLCQPAISDRDFRRRKTP